MPYVNLRKLHALEVEMTLIGRGEGHTNDGLPEVSYDTSCDISYDIRCRRASQRDILRVTMGCAPIKPGSTDSCLLHVIIRARWLRLRPSTGVQPAFGPLDLPSHPPGAARDGSNRWIRAKAVSWEEGLGVGEGTVQPDLEVKVAAGGSSRRTY